MKLANFVTKLQDVFILNNEYKDIEGHQNLPGRRLNVPEDEVERIYQRKRKKVVRVEYTGFTKADCIGCGRRFLFSANGRGRHPEYHSNACKQSTYRVRKKTGVKRGNGRARV